ncbi:family 41 glycosyltransferase [Cryphonectria parasitica EP155]|uniref:protein O-GlcNAc transferase n=1 Tax=Cryphonectria parasitica (strain ATCC 38755 / EP155) TaxID=660469 RepID=A0A9P4XTE1_CRYP1|nr:family 41 glycosyltransferase [Cryphonectria parasitica EP155]KAF3760435.1 family 41 glycosyltransferase [Cryphonectria parasitica EP155]
MADGATPIINYFNQHSLRRKTPNGTIDHGYDGTPTQLAAGPPPQKYLNLTPSGDVFPSPSSGRSLSAMNNNSPSWFSISQSPGAGRTENDAFRQAVDAASGGYRTQGSLGYSPGYGSMMPSPSAQMHAMSLSPSLRGPFGTYPNPSAASPAVPSPLGFNPSTPLYADGPLVGFPQPMVFSSGYPPHNIPYESGFVAVQAPLPQGALVGQGYGQNSPFQMPYMLDDGFARHSLPSTLQSPHRLQNNLSLASSPTAAAAVAAAAASAAAGAGGNAGDGSQQNFKESVLLSAHKAYSDLVTHATRLKKVQHGRTASRSLKSIIFPRPPKHLVSRPAPHLQRSPQSFPGAVAGYLHPHQPTVTATVYGNVMLQSNPRENAKASLEMLRNLCEQTNWQWIDGMLMGGCLCYSLERHEDGLEWFKRIVVLDENHVEALSNIGATLYCLNRLDEAERYWNRVIDTRPDYLEAVEHLVGLLGSTQRNREAVEIIERVQHKLRIQPYDELHRQKRHKKGIGTDSAQAGEMTPLPNSDEALAAQAVRKLHVSTRSQEDFGSSGYNIPASENGKMLGLIHAKGNMLYTLRQINRASMDFEEAVLISAGRDLGCIQNLIRRIQLVLAPRPNGSQPIQRQQQQQQQQQTPLSAPLLLAPEAAKRTAELVFSMTGGQLPGLRYVADGAQKKTAMSTTSNALLSLAKIFQDAMSSGASNVGPTAQPSSVSDILALYYLSLSLQESPSTANNVGILLASVQQAAPGPATVSAFAYSQRLPGITQGSGLELALAYYQYGLYLDKHHVHLHTNLGSLLKDIGQLDLAIQMYERAVECDGTFDIALTNLANAVKDRGRIEEAIRFYRRAVDANPEFAEAVCGLSTALNSVCDWKGRGGVYLNGGKFDRWHVDAKGMLVDAQESRSGFGLMKKVVDIVARQLKEASRWGVGTTTPAALAQLVSLLTATDVPTMEPSLDLESELQAWAGKPWEGSKLLRLIERLTRTTTRKWYLDRHVRGVESPRGYPRVRPPNSLTIPSAPTVLPFHTFTNPLTAKDVRRISQRNALRISCSTLRSPWLPKSVYPPPAPPKPCLNIGYVSSDFNNHPLAHLMQSVFGFHNQARAKAFCYATTASDKSVHRQQIENEAPVFRDVSSWSSDKLVEQIVKDGIHILVNLNGYTRGARNEIFAARPAPIQMSFMGFAGTLGAEWCDYLLADTTAIPPETLRPYRSNLTLSDVFRDDAEGEAEDWVYSENIIFCRDTFFCCDHRQSADMIERGVTWEEEQSRRWVMRKSIFPDIPDDAIILGNFNQLYKIDPTTFRTWLRILDKTPKAILWLLKFPELGERALRETAEEWAPHVAKRIYFTDVAPKQHHISRARVCDLFLDTPECNAHTTAADVLWSSTPLLTLTRYKYKMCSRMAASILKGALPRNAAGNQAATDLIAEDDQTYEEKAIKLANGISYRMSPQGYGQAEGRLWDLRKLLFEAKWSCALFNTRRWVRDLEDAYEEAWRRWVNGIEGDIYL